MKFFERVLFEGSELDYGKEFLQLLKHTLEQHGLGVGSWEDALALIEKYRDGSLAGPLTATLDTLRDQLGLTKESISNWIDALRIRLLKKLPGELQPLLKNLSELEPEPALAWPLIQKSSNSAGSLSKIKLELEADAELALQLDVLNADEVRQFTSQIVPADTCGLLLSSSGRIAASAGATLPFSFGTGTVTTEGHIAYDLAYLYQQPARSLLVQSLAGTVTHLPYPLDATSIAGNFNQGLKKVSLEVDGEIRLSASLNIGKSWNYQYVSEAVDDAAEIDVTASIGAGASALITRNGHFEISLTPDPDGTQVLIDLTRSGGESSNRALRLGADLEIAGLDQVAVPLAEKFLPDAQPLINKLEQLARPSEWLVAKVSATGLVGNDSLLSDIVEALGNLDSTADLTSLLKSKVSAVVERLDINWAEDSKKVATEIIVRVANSLNLPASLQVRFVSSATVEMGELIDRYVGALESKVGESIQSITDGAAIKKVFGVLDELEEGITKGLAEANKTAQDVLAPVLEVVNRYQTLRSKIVRAAEGAAKLQLGVALTSSRTRTSSEEILLRLVLDTQNRKALECYRQIIRGDFSEALQAARTPGTDAGVRVLSGSFSRLASEEYQLSFSLNVFGLLASSTLKTAASVSASWDLQGNLIAWRGEQSFERVSKFLGDSQSVMLRSGLEHVSGDGASGLRRMPILWSAGVSKTDKRLRKEEFRKFLGAFEETGLIAPGTVARSLTALFGDRLIGKAKLKNTTLSVAMSMEPEDLRRVATRPMGDVHQVSVSRLLQAFRQLERFGFDEQGFDEPLHVLGFDSSPDGILQIMNGGMDVHQLFQRIAREKEVRMLQKDQDAFALELANKVEKITFAARSMWALIATYQALLTETADTANPEVALKHGFSQINRALKPWLATNLFSDAPDQCSIAFMLTILELSGVDPTSGPLVPLARVSRGGDAFEDLVLA